MILQHGLVMCTETIALVFAKATLTSESRHSDISSANRAHNLCEFRRELLQHNFKLSEMEQAVNLACEKLLKCCGK